MSHARNDSATSVRLAVLAQDEHLIASICDIINVAYRVGEHGILVDTAAAPLQRAITSEVRDWVQHEQLLILQTTHDVLGCVKATLLDESGSGEAAAAASSSSPQIGTWGCLAVTPEHQGRGYGRMLVQAAEKYLHANGARTLQVELLAPTTWHHTHKERLRAWYIKLSYALPYDSYNACTQKLAQDTWLVPGRFQLLTDSDFTTYRKVLS